jgi:hypothetical protein
MEKSEPQALSEVVANDMSHTRIARAGGHMKIDIATTTVFARFYAIMFGRILNRLSN